MKCYMDIVHMKDNQ